MPIANRSAFQPTRQLVVFAATTAPRRAYGSKASGACRRAPRPGLLQISHLGSRSCCHHASDRAMAARLAQPSSATLLASLTATGPFRRAVAELGQRGVSDVAVDHGSRRCLLLCVPEGTATCLAVLTQASRPCCSIPNYPSPPRRSAARFGRIPAAAALAERKAGLAARTSAVFPSRPSGIN